MCVPVGRCRGAVVTVVAVVAGAHLEYSQQLSVLELLELELLLELAVSGLVLLQHLDVLHGGPQDGALVLPHVLHQVMVSGAQNISITTRILRDNRDGHREQDLLIGCRKRISGK